MFVFARNAPNYSSKFVFANTNFVTSLEATGSTTAVFGQDAIKRLVLE